jgi:hypothetical protein
MYGKRRPDLMVQPQFINPPITSVQPLQGDDSVRKGIFIRSLLAVISLLLLPVGGCVFEVWNYPGNWFDYSETITAFSEVGLFLIPAAIMMLYCCVQSFRAKSNPSLMPDGNRIRKLCLISIILCLASIVLIPFAAESIVMDHTADGLYGTDDAGVRLDMWYPHVGYLLSPILIYILKKQASKI